MVIRISQYQDVIPDFGSMAAFGGMGHWAGKGGNKTGFGSIINVNVSPQTARIAALELLSIALA
jgi:hypothetical protein